MKSKKEIAIEKIMADFEILANLVFEQLDQVAKLLEQKEISLSKNELEDFENQEKKIDKLEVKLSERIVNTIVLFQPVASEIRQIIASYRIVNSLERVGDYAVNLVDFMNKIKSIKVYNELSELMSTMLQSAMERLKKALVSFVQQEKESALWVLKNKDEFNQMNQKMLKNLIDKSIETDEKKKVIISFITIKEMIDNIERIADHASNIAEASIYYLEGKDIRHVPFFDED